MKKYWETYPRLTGNKNPSFGKRKSNKEKIMISQKTKEGMAKSKKWEKYKEYIAKWKYNK